jgi:hypothetical protein
VKNDERVKTTVVGHREAHYKGEPKSDRVIRRLDERIPITPR